MTQFSAIIITKNAAAHIEDCLASVAWCDEIVVVDCGSTDETVAGCRSFTDNIVVTDDWPGFERENRGQTTFNMACPKIIQA